MVEDAPPSGEGVRDATGTNRAALLAVGVGTVTFWPLPAFAVRRSPVLVLKTQSAGEGRLSLPGRLRGWNVSP